MNISICKSKQNPNSDIKPRCYTCLSTDRDLKPMKTEEKFLLGMLCPEMFFHNKGNVQNLYLMCWECKYMIVKIKRFQAKVSKAQAQMKLKLQGVESIVDSISDLRITGIVRIDVPPQFPTDQNQLKLNEIPQPLSPILTSLKVDPEIIESSIEEEETIVNDYDELIIPTKITQPSSDESTDTASDSESNDDTPRTPSKVDVPPPKATKRAIVSPNDLALRGYKEAVKVTSGVPNLVTVENVPILVKKKASVPTLRKTKDGITITFKDMDGASIVANEDTGGDLNLIKLKVAPTCSKLEEPVLKGAILPTCPNPPKEPECEQRADMDDDEEDQVKCTILNEAELKTFRDKKRSRRGYKGHPYKCEKCIQTFPDKKFLDQHIKKHDKMQANISMEIREKIVALHKNGLNFSQISNETGINRHSVSRWVKRFEEERSLKSRMRPGRPPLINPTQRRSMVKECETNVFISPRTFADQFETSVSTVRRALRREGLHYNNRKSAKRRHKYMRNEVVREVEGRRFLNPTQRYFITEEHETNVFIPTRTFVDQFDMPLRTVRCALHAEGFHRKPAKKKFRIQNQSRGPSMCKVCEQRFPNKSVRNEHFTEHFIIYECLNCQYQDNDRFKTILHIRRVHKVSAFDCKKCGAVFKTYREKRRHVLTVHSTSIKSTCEECGKTFPSLTLLKTHMSTHQRETTVCPVCKKKIRKNYFDKHMKIHDDNRVDSAYCIDCGKMFKSEKSYAWHLKTSLKHNALENFGIKCDHCNKYFHTRIALKDHLEEVNGIKYTCDICKKDIKNKTSLVRHIRLKHEGRKYQLKPRICEHCGKSFYSKQELKNHINSHLGLRPYVCKDCGATFSSNSALFTHRRLVHKVKRRYEMQT